jgi:hypothetical protein
MQIPCQFQNNEKPTLAEEFRDAKYKILYYLIKFFVFGKEN